MIYTNTAILSKWKPIFEYIPLESQIEKFQDGYYEAIARCHTEGSSNSFIEFMLEQIDKVLDEISEQAHEEGEQISEYVRRLLAVMELHLIEMTIPEKPSSRNQRYIKR